MKRASVRARPDNDDVNRRAAGPAACKTDVQALHAEPVRQGAQLKMLGWWGYGDRKCRRRLARNL